MDILKGDILLDKTFHEIVIDSIDIGIMGSDLEGNLLTINKAAEKMWDFPKEIALGKSFLLALAEKERSRMKKTFDYVIKTGRSVRANEVVFVNRSGKTLYINSYASVVKYSGDHIGVAMWTEDITEQRKLQMEIQRADRLAALGQLALGISHEVRTPLASIKALAALIKSAIGSDDQKIKYINVMINEVNRLDKLSRELLDFAAKRSLTIEQVDINDLINKVLYLAKVNSLSDHINIKEDLKPGLPLLYCDKEKILQTLMNLVINALEAVNAPGTVTIETFYDHEWLGISVIDNGAGINDDDINKIFDPLYTTKEHGTGLGLSIVHSIVKDHGGRVEVESQLNKGTKFTIRLPIERGGRDKYE